MNLIFEEALQCYIFYCFEKTFRSTDKKIKGFFVVAFNPNNLFVFKQYCLVWEWDSGSAKQDALIVFVRYDLDVCGVNYFGRVIHIST